MLAVYFSGLCDSILGLGQSLNDEQIIPDARLSQRLVFDDEIAAQKRYGWMHIWCNFVNREGSETASNFWRANVKAEHGNRK